MRHECTCGFELAPENNVEPVGAVSHGLCAPCVIKLMGLVGKKHPIWYPVRIGGYRVELRIQPGRQAPHVGFDSPRYWEGSRPIRVIDARVSRDGVELDPDEHRNLLALACERANVPAPGGPSSIRPASSRQLRLRLDGLLRKAMERTGYLE